MKYELAANVESALSTVTKCITDKSSTGPSLTLKVNVLSKLRPSGSVAVNVMVDVPAASGDSVIVVPTVDIPTTVGLDEDAVNVMVSPSGSEKYWLMS